MNASKERGCTNISLLTIRRKMFIHVFRSFVFVLSTDASQMSHHVGRDRSQCWLGDQ